MSNLLAIETAFLRDANIETALDLRSIQGLQRTLNNGQKKKFSQTLELAKKVVLAVDWFKSDPGKAAMTEAGIYWTTEQVGNKVFGWQKSYLYKVIKAGNLPDEKVDKFKELCDECIASGNEPNRTLEGLLKFAKSGGNEDSEEAQIEVRTATIFTMAYKRDSGNVAVRVDENNKLITTNTHEEIVDAIQFLSNFLHYYN